MTRKQRALAKKKYSRMLKEMNDTQCRDILKHMMEHGSITAMEAVEEYGCYRLSARIADLREMGVEIVTLMMENSHNSGHHAKYILDK